MSDVNLLEILLRDEIKALRSRLVAAERERDEIKEALRIACKAGRTDFAERERAEARCARLEAALKEIEATKKGYQDVCWEIARAALARERAILAEED